MGSLMGSRTFKMMVQCQHDGERIKVNSIMAPPTRPVLLASGAQVGVRVPTRIKQKIWLHKYLIFMTFCILGQIILNISLLVTVTIFPKINFGPNKRRPLTESEWGSAWDDSNLHQKISRAAQ